MRILFSFLLFINIGESAKIVIVNSGIGRSHLQFLDGVCSSLVDAGHTVHMIVTSVSEYSKTFRSRKAQKTIIIPNLEENVYNSAECANNPFKVETFNMARVYMKSLEQTTKDVVYHYDDYIKPLREENYDIGISQLMGFYAPCVLHLLNVRSVVIASACPLSPVVFSLMGYPLLPSFVPNPYADDIPMNGEPMSFSQRSLNLIKFGFLRILGDEDAEQALERFRVIDPDLPDPRDITRNASLILVNTHPLLDHPHPISHRILHIGGIEVKRKRHSTALSEEILEIMNGSLIGIVLVSFGSIVRTEFIKGDLLEIFLSSFSHFQNYSFIFKYDTDEEQRRAMREKYGNVFPFSWIPQTEILSHPKTRLFVSHMGGNSFAETAYNGVPIVAIPLFVDQIYNTAAGTRQGTTLYLNKRNISKESLVEAMSVVLAEGSSFRKNAERLRQELEDFPEDLEQKMIKYIGFISTNGRIPMWDSLGSQMSLFTYYSIDVLLPVLLLVQMVLVLLVYSIIYIFVRFLRNKKQKKCE